MGIRLAEVHHCVCVITPLSITLSLGLDWLTMYMVGRITDMWPPGMTEMVALTVAVPGGAVAGERGADILIEDYDFNPHLSML